MLDRDAILKTIYDEFRKHHYDIFDTSTPDDHRPIMAPGCTTCKVRTDIVNLYQQHLMKSVLEAVARANGR
jgi:hypothetical protein